MYIYAIVNRISWKWCRWRRWAWIKFFIVRFVVFSSWFIQNIPIIGHTQRITRIENCFKTVKYNPMNKLQGRMFSVVYFFSSFLLLSLFPSLNSVQSACAFDSIWYININVSRSMQRGMRIILFSFFCLQHSIVCACVCYYYYIFKWTLNDLFILKINLLCFVFVAA